jgi:hypothetical protein
MRAVISTALAVIGLAACGPAAALAGPAGHLRAGAACSPARDQSYESRGYACVQTAGGHRLAPIVAAPARPHPPGRRTLPPPPKK